MFVLKLMNIPTKKLEGHRELSVLSFVYFELKDKMESWVQDIGSCFCASSFAKPLLWTAGSEYSPRLGSTVRLRLRVRMLFQNLTKAN